MINEETSKGALRHYYRERLKALSKLRRKEAEENLSKRAHKLTCSFTSVLSFVSTPLEISTSLLNQHLLSTNKLYLPAICQDNLLIYKVENLSFLQRGAFNILEPNPKLCSLANKEEIDCILVPARAFDKNKNRLGRGKGYYDRFIQKLHKKNLFPKLIGVGFTEQLYEKDLPCGPFDEKLDELLLL